VSTRAEHYRIAEELLAQAANDQAKAAVSVSATTRSNLHGDVRLYLRAAQIHATLAAAGPGVEQAVADLVKREQQATQAERQADRPPLPTVLIAEQSADAARPRPRPPIAKGV